MAPTADIPPKTENINPTFPPPPPILVVPAPVAALVVVLAEEIAAVALATFAEAEATA